MPGGVGDGVLVHSAAQVEAGGEERGPVGIAQFHPHIVVEIRLQVRVTQAQGHRVGVVHYRVQLAGGRLSAAAVVGDTDVGVVVEVVEQHGAGSEVPDGSGVVLLAVGEVVLIGGDCRTSQLGPQAVILVHKGQADVLVEVAGNYAVAVRSVIRLVFRLVLHKEVTHHQRRCIVVIVRRVAVVDELVGGGVGPVHLVTAFQIEVVAQRFGVYQACAQALLFGGLVDTLVYQRRFGEFSRVKHIGKGLVESVHRVVLDVPVYVEGESPARHAQTLAQEGAAVGREVLVYAGVVGVTVVGAVPFIHRILPIVKDRLLYIIAAAEAELRLDHQRGVVGELVVDAETHPMTVGIPVAAGSGLLNEGGTVGLVSFLIRILQGVVI